MSSTVISIENLSKYYRLGVIGGSTFREEFSRWWAKRLRRPDPYEKIGESNLGNREGDHLWALRDLNLEVREGEVLGIIGRNGAGKSTLLKILSRITAPTAGRAVIRGRVGSLLEVGTGFHPELTGRENSYLNGTILGMTKAEVDGKLEEIVEFAEIRKFIDTPVKRYSSGMIVRLAFAVAAHLEPEILIVDEVLAVGDVTFQSKCLSKMQDISAEGRTVLFVSHNMNAISGLCSRAVLVEAGSISMSGTPTAVTAEYLKSAIRGESKIVFCENDKRRGDGNLTFHSIAVGDHPNDLEVATIKYSSSLSVEVEVRSTVKVRNVNVAIIIHDGGGARILDLNLAKARERLTLQENAKAMIRFTVPDIHLTSGVYTVSLWAGIGKVVTHDQINSPIKFVVVNEQSSGELETFPGAYSPPFEVEIEKTVGFLSHHHRSA